MRNFAIEIKWGVLFTLMTLAWITLEKFTGLHSTHIDKHAVYTNIMAIPAIAIYVFALLDKRKNFYRGYMSYLQGFVCGLWVTAVVLLLEPLTQWITFNYITPDFFTNMINYAVSSGKMERTAAEEYFNLSSYMRQGLIGVPVMGVVTSAIVAFFTKKKNPHAPKEGRTIIIPSEQATKESL